jgi:hypothetical protein
MNIAAAHARGECLMRKILLLLACAGLAGCGNLSTRLRQKWKEVKDPRLLKTCLVTNWGAGVWLAHDDTGSYVLTSANVLKGFDDATVSLVDPVLRRYEEFDADVVARSHREKVALVLLRLRERPSFAKPFTTRLANPFKPGQEREVDLMVITADRPVADRLSVFEHKMRVGAKANEDESDADGAWWTVSRGCLHGGSIKVSPGAPVFEGEALVGLVESSPGMAKRKNDDGTEELFIGATIGLPNDILAFLRASKDAHLLTQGE